VRFEETPKVWRDLMDKGKSFHTTDAEQLKVHLPNSDVAESRANKFWSSPDRTDWYYSSNKCR